MLNTIATQDASLFALDESDPTLQSPPAVLQCIGLLAAALSLYAGPVLNLSFLVDDVMENAKPLYWDAVIEAPIPLKVCKPPSCSGLTLPQSCLISHQL